MKTRVVVKRYAEIELEIWDFRVYENGYVERFGGNGWEWLGASDDDYDLVLEAGLAALKEAQ